MNMIGNLLGGLVSDEQKMEAIKEVIQDALEDVAEEYDLQPNELFFTIQPISDDFEFAIFAYKIAPDGNEKLREVPLKEILG